MTNWKEQFEERFAGVIGHPLHARIPMEDFISQQFEKLIADIPDDIFSANKGAGKVIKQQLRDKWL